MNRQTKVFRAHRAIAFFYAIVGLGMVAAMFVGAHGKIDLSIVPMLLILTAVFSIHFFTARACRAGKQGGRVASITLAFLMLLAFPIGTIIGIYLLVHTWKPWPATGEVAAP